MPFTAQSFKKHKKGMTDAQAKKGARIANGILKSCLKSGKSQSTCDRIAIATALKNVIKGAKRVT
jgi:hypothetical protein